MYGLGGLHNNAQNILSQRLSGVRWRREPSFEPYNPSQPVLGKGRDRPRDRQRPPCGGNPNPRRSRNAQRGTVKARLPPPASAPDGEGGGDPQKATNWPI
ncbi:hypothetical protein SKAU_G00004300 [Synaphobranchus kaupii]|uniref:Uncharacterized protein n=1 Tax=Synaphobranchus kaupii TaxID=118154 RepID=A0A9Q1GAG9_SYNKA|nr:hypothetical protein SKAU_G00004300 [Synaphobranchus kaupii]